MTKRRPHMPLALYVSSELKWFLLGGLSACYQGRDVSRITGKPTHVKLPDNLVSYEDIVSVSFHKSEKGETLKQLEIPDQRWISVQDILQRKRDVVRPSHNSKLHFGKNTL